MEIVLSPFCPSMVILLKMTHLMIRLTQTSSHLNNHLRKPLLHATDIRQLQAERDKLRLEAHNKNNDESWAAFRTIRNKIKVVTSKAKRSFFLNALSSKRPKEV